MAASISETGRPDVLWVLTTQWRASACGYAGDPNACTPTLDRLAAEGVNYTQAVTPHPFGPFARAAVLTGVRSPANGVRDYFDPLPAGTRTIAHAMSERGYATAWFGKWHLARRDPAVALVGEAHARMVVPEAARGGFDYWEGFESGFLLNDPWLHGTRLAEPRQFAGYQSDVVCERAGGWLAEQATPWFGVVSLEAPHPPYAAPAAGVAPRAEADIMLPPNVPRGGEVEARARRELAGYYAHIEATDRAIGRLIESLDTAAALGGRAKPIVVVTSVHGDMHGANGLFRKGWPHEESVRVPLVVRGAPGWRTEDGELRTEDGERRTEDGGRRTENGGQRTGGTSDARVTLAELPAMTLAWAAGEAAKCEREAAEISMPSVVALPGQCDRAWRGWRSSTRKLVLGPDGAPWLFFDLERDPGETTNLAGDASRRAELKEFEARWTAR